MPSVNSVENLRKHSGRLFAAAVMAGVLAAGPVQAQSNSSEPEMLLEEGTKKILRAFELFIMTIPQYEMPEVLPNGDIIIRRKNPSGEKDKNAPVVEPPIAGEKT
ncbi:MAG: hypothetical protein RIA64_07230 [Rhodospirillales bacterium]